MNANVASVNAWSQNVGDNWTPVTIPREFRGKHLNKKDVYWDEKRQVLTISKNLKLFLIILNSCFLFFVFWWCWCFFSVFVVDNYNIVVFVLLVLLCCRFCRCWYYCVIVLLLLLLFVIVFVVLNCPLCYRCFIVWKTVIIYSC